MVQGHQQLHVQNYLKIQVLKMKMLIMCDRKGVIYRGRDKLDQWKSKHAIETKFRTLEEAIKGADVFLGLSAKDALTKEYG